MPLWLLYHRSEINRSVRGERCILLMPAWRVLGSSSFSRRQSCDFVITNLFFFFFPPLFKFHSPTTIIIFCIYSPPPINKSSFLCHLISNAVCVCVFVQTSMCCLCSPSAAEEQLWWEMGSLYYGYGNGPRHMQLDWYTAWHLLKWWNTLWP